MAEPHQSRSQSVNGVGSKLQKRTTESQPPMSSANWPALARLEAGRSAGMNWESSQIGPAAKIEKRPQMTRSWQ